MDIFEYLDTSANLVNRAINKYINNIEDIPPLLKKSMLYSINSGGKRIRPALMFATYEMFGGKKEDIIPFACAIEMIHTYSLIHDDLPSMDDDDLRRGKPTNHKVFGEGIAILSGDGLLTNAFNIIANSRKFDDTKKIKVVEILSKRAGCGGMVGGQVVDLISEGILTKKSNKKKLSKIINYIHTHKTADMIMASCEIGCILAGEDKLLNLISEFSKNIGISFQIADDLLDVIGDKKELGKKGSDIENKKLTYASLYGIKTSQEKAEKYLNNALNILNKISTKGSKKILKDIAIYIVRRDKWDTFHILKDQMI